MDLNFFSSAELLQPLDRNNPPTHSSTGCDANRLFDKRLHNLPHQALSAYRLSLCKIQIGIGFLNSFSLHSGRFADFFFFAALLHASGLFLTSLFAALSPTGCSLRKQSAVFRKQNLLFRKQTGVLRKQSLVSRKQLLNPS